jgi:signal transduction histidine kinase
MPGSDPPEQTPRPPLTYRITPGQWLAIDVGTAVVATVLITFDLHLIYAPHFTVPSAPVAALTVAATLPVAVRRIWPLPVLGIVVAAVAILTALGRAPLSADLMLGMASYMAALRLPRPVAVGALVAAEAAIAAGLLSAAAAGRTSSGLLHSMLVAAAMWFAGDGVREHRRYRAAIAEQAAQRQQAEAARDRAAAGEERLRIARELHDVLAHTLSVVAVHAGVGRRVGAARPAEALRALAVVEESSRGALDELRRILGLLRGDDEPGTSGPGSLPGHAAPEPALAPAPGLADLVGLAATVRSAGTPVSLTVTGDADAVPATAALTVYRIVQEALTNVVKHAPGAEAAVRIRIGADGVRIRVTDTGSASGAHPASGAQPLAAGARQHGIAGMRERAAAFGGTLEASPTTGGFHLTAFLPVASGRRAA